MVETYSTESNVQRNNGITARNLAASVMSGFVIAGGAASSTEAVPANSAGLSDCAPYFDTAKYRNHEYEACTAYIGNSASIALRGFYKYGNNRIGYLANPARHHFETRYWTGARQTIERDVNSWPETGNLTGNKVIVDVDLVSVSSNLKANRGLLKTQESWDVTSSKGRVLHHEPRHTKNITMCRGRLPGHPLHAWFVVKFVRDPSFNCIAFDKRHNIAP